MTPETNAAKERLREELDPRTTTAKIPKEFRPYIAALITAVETSEAGAARMREALTAQMKDMHTKQMKDGRIDVELGCCRPCSTCDASRAALSSTAGVDFLVEKQRLEKLLHESLAREEGLSKTSFSQVCNLSQVCNERDSLALQLEKALAAIVEFHKCIEASIQLGELDESTARYVEGFIKDASLKSLTSHNLTQQRAAILWAAEISESTFKFEFKAAGDVIGRELRRLAATLEKPVEVKEQP